MSHSLVQRTAMHEAGHVIAALALDFSVAYSILRERDGRVSGYTETRMPMPDGCAGDLERAREFINTPAVVRRRVMQALAGVVAEDMFFGDGDDGDYAAVRADFDSARDFIRDAQGPLGLPTAAEGADYMKARHAECGELLDKHKGALVNASNLLLASPNRKVYGKFFRLDTAAGQ